MHTVKVNTDPLPREDSHKLRILWIKVGGLWPIDSGGRLRSFHTIAQLSRRHRVSLVTTHTNESDGKVLAAQLPDCERIIALPVTAHKSNSIRFIPTLIRSWLSTLPVDLYKHRFPALAREVSHAMQSGEYDLCIADFLVSLPNVPKYGDVPIVYFSHNVEYMIWRRLNENEPSWIKKALLALEWRKMRRYERLACQSVAHTISVSCTDSAELSRLSGRQNITAVPTGVDTTYFRPHVFDGERNPSLVFTGSMDWYPNEEAMLYFMRDILPAIRKQVPDVSFSIVGRNPGPLLKQVAAESDVTVSGTVDDVRPWIASAAVYVVPLRVGGGTRLKIYEALAMGKAVVSTTIGAEGLPLRSGIHFIQADEAQEFTSAVVELLNDSVQRQRLGTAGRRLVAEHFSWPVVTTEFENICKNVYEDYGKVAVTDLSLTNTTA